MQDVEFTIEHGKLWMLQTRDGKRTAQAAVRIAVDMADESLITSEEAVLPRDAPSRWTSSCTPSSTGREAAARRAATAWPRAQRLARRGGGRSRLRRRHGRALGQATSKPRHHGPAGDQARRRARHARRPGHPDQPGRPHQPRRPGGAPVRQARRGRAWTPWRSTSRSASSRSADACFKEGDVDLDRRDRRRGVPRGSSRPCCPDIKDP